MLEVIGFVVAAYIAFKVIRRIFRETTRGTIRKALSYAAEKGVPYDFGKKMIYNSEIIEKSIQLMGQQDPLFRENTVYIQYGEALIMLYHDFLSEK